MLSMAFSFEVLIPSNSIVQRCMSGCMFSEKYERGSITSLVPSSPLPSSKYSFLLLAVWEKVWGEPGNEASCMWGEPGNEASCMWREPGNEASCMWGEPGNEASCVWEEPGNGASCMWGEPGNEASCMWPGESLGMRLVACGESLGMRLVACGKSLGMRPVYKFHRWKLYIGMYVDPCVLLHM